MDTDNAIKAIDTIYDGYKFRSRLEARWAVFFNEMGIAYEYEKEGYDLGGIWYLPDFWLPKQQCWIEIKGQAPTDEEEEKAGKLAVLTGKNVYIFYGPIPMPSDRYPTDEANSSGLMCDSESGGDIHHVWCECSSCGAVGIEFDGRSDRLPCKRCISCERYLDDNFWKWMSRTPNALRREDAICRTHGTDYERDKCPRSGGNYDKGYNADSFRLKNAYAVARQARFEHGEVPLSKTQHK